MNYDLAKQLQGAGFPQKGKGEYYLDSNYQSLIKRQNIVEDRPYAPTLSELIEACGDQFGQLVRFRGGWVAMADWNHKDTTIPAQEGEGSTPEEAVAKLWLQLNKTTA